MLLDVKRTSVVVVPLSLVDVGAELVVVVCGATEVVVVVGSCVELVLTRVVNSGIGSVVSGARI